MLPRKWLCVDDGFGTVVMAADDGFGTVEEPREVLTFVGTALGPLSFVLDPLCTSNATLGAARRYTSRRRQTQRTVFFNTIPGRMWFPGQIM